MVWPGRGRCVPVTGIVLTPAIAPQNPGPGGARPIVTHLPVTRGLADSCAPSSFYDPTTVEPRNIEPLQAPAYPQQLAAGATVVITDDGRAIFERVRASCIGEEFTEHVGSLVVAGIPAANRWILDRLAGVPVSAGCTRHANFTLG